jgi:hypothetical protein
MDPKKKAVSAHDQMKNSYINTVMYLKVLQQQKTFRDLMNNKILQS